jgi:hypothetical protein
MALATQADVEERLGRALSDAEAARVPSLLDDATAVVVGYAGMDFEPSPYPAAVVGVTAKMVARVLAAGDVTFADQQSTGPFSIKFNANASSGDVYFTKADRLALRPYRVGGGLSSIGLVGDRYSITPTTP